MALFFVFASSFVLMAYHSNRKVIIETGTPAQRMVLPSFMDVYHLCLVHACEVVGSHTPTHL